MCAEPRRVLGNNKKRACCWHQQHPSVCPFRDQAIPGESGTQTSDPKDDTENRLLGWLEMRGGNTREATRVGNNGLHSWPPHLGQHGKGRHRVPPPTPARARSRHSPANKAHLLAGTQGELFWKVLEVWMEYQLDKTPLHLTPMALPPSALLPLLESALYHVTHHVMTSHGRFHVPAYLPPALLFALTGGSQARPSQLPQPRPCHPPACSLTCPPLLP